MTFFIVLFVLFKNYKKNFNQAMKLFKQFYFLNYHKELYSLISTDIQIPINYVNYNPIYFSS